jgi:cytochrome c556
MKPASLVFAVLLGLDATAATAADTHSHHGAHAPADDTRAVLELSDTERAMILEEMRLFLSGVQKMTAALAQQDMAAVAAEAREMGVKMTHEVPPALRAKLPQEFRQLGFSVHRDFDELALDAENIKDAGHSLKQLSATLKKCVSCHATYQIRSQPLAALH